MDQTSQVADLDSLDEEGDSSPTTGNFRPKSLSQSSGSDEWVLVNSLGNEVEKNSGTRVNNNNDVETAANFTAPVMENAAASLSINLKPSADAICSTVAIAASPKADDPKVIAKEDAKSELESIPSATVEVSTDITLAAPSSISDITDDGIKDEFSRAEEKTIKRSASSEFSSQISLLDHQEDLVSSSMSSSMSSSTEFEMLLSSNPRADQIDDEPRGDEPALRVPNDDPSPILEIANRIRNYIQAYDLALNWKLSVLIVVASAAVLGLGLGHIIGSASVSRWSPEDILDRKALNNGPEAFQNRQDELHLRDLENQLAVCVDKLHRAREEDEPGTSKDCKDGYCLDVEKPNCQSDGDVRARISSCQTRVYSCENALHDLKQAREKRSIEMARAFYDLRLLRQNLMQVHSSYEKLSAVLQAERKNLREEKSQTSENQRRAADELAMKLKEAESREDMLIKQEHELRRALSSLESTVAALNAELAKLKNQRGDGGHDQQHRGEEPTTDESDGDEENASTSTEDDTEFSWNRLTELLRQLKDSTHVDEILETYFDAVKDLKLPEINVSKLWSEQLPSSLEGVAKQLKEGLEEKVREVEHVLYETNWDEYVQKAKTVSDRVGETVGAMWRKARDLSEHVREQHGEHGEKIINEIKSTMERAADVFDKRWEQAAQFWHDVIGGESTGEGEEEIEDDVDEEIRSDREEDDGKDQVWIYDADGGNEQINDENASGDQSIGNEEQSSGSDQQFAEDQSSNDDSSNGWIRDEHEIKKKGETSRDFNQYSNIDHQKGVMFEYFKKKFTGSQAASEVKQLRDGLKSSSSLFSRYVTDEFADHYLRRLKQTGRALHQDERNRDDSGGEQSIWWLCQKLWWTRHSFAYGRQCSDKLMTWQRHQRSDATTDVREKLADDGAPQLRSLLKKFTNDDSLKRGGDDRTVAAANWVFEWARNRQEMRRQQEEQQQQQKGDSWIYERWRNRDQIRQDQHDRQEEDESVGSKWLFRRGKGRDQKRGDRNGKESKKQNRRR